MKTNKPLLIAALATFFIVNMTAFALKKVLDEWGYAEFEVSGWPLYKALRNEIHYIKGIYFRKTIQE
ncbi:hypothetical protein LCGC14_1665350 [marine sediment metagenome]|uniref:Uncharacterized protein n=1 Tax=marine sediment metagenome TaxID=412755 RepID=A0A0F9HSS7_9ZZZZ